MNRKSIARTMAMSLVVAGLLPISVLAQVAKFGEPIRKGEYDSYIAQDGAEYKVGDKIKNGTPVGGNKTFSYINMYPGGMLFGPSPCPATCAGLEYEIVGFRQTRQGDSFSLWSKMKAPNAFTGTITVNFENALRSGELVGRGDQALRELRKWKEMLDLGLISIEEYEEKKKELSRYIK